MGDVKRAVAASLIAGAAIACSAGGDDDGATDRDAAASADARAGSSRGGAGSASGQATGHPVREQGDAPAGYCPGVEVVASQSPSCWDGNDQGCERCAPPLMTFVCTGNQLQPIVSTPIACTDDSGCPRPDTHCEPGEPGADEYGCRRTPCDQDEDCPDDMVCDPTSPLANQPASEASGARVVPGCRLRHCGDEGAPSCGLLRCDPTAAGAATLGCVPASCAANSSCPDGTFCATGVCIPIPCDQAGAAACEPGTRCQPNRGCIPIHCSEPGGFSCRPGTICDPLMADNGGCRVARCNEQGAPPCHTGTTCRELPDGSFACLQCLQNSDCGCGSCIHHVCYDRPGSCEPGCP